MEMRALQDELLGCLIGLARTCSSNPATDETEGLLLAGLVATRPDTPMTADQLTRLTARVKADKAKVSPNCVTCTSRCGKNDDYDMARLYAAPDDVREAKLAILRNMQGMAAKGVVDQLTFDGLFALAEDWDAPALAWYVEKTAKKL